MGTKSWEWEGMGTRKSLPHISKRPQDVATLAVDGRLLHLGHKAGD